MTRRSAAWLIGLVACSPAERPSGPDLEVLRISTHRGLATLVPPTGETMSATLFELVCPLAVHAFDIHDSGDGNLELRPRTTTRSLAELATLVRHQALVSARAHGDRLRVVLGPEADARLLCIEDGPYRVSSQTPTELVLERRVGTGVPRIHVFSVRDSEEEWRRFLARQVDIVPIVSRGQIRYLRELTSVKLTPAETSASIGLIFNTARVPLQIRRAIALGIHRKAVVRSLGLDESRAAASPEDAAEGEKLAAAASPAPTPFRVITFEGDADMRRAALVVEENLNRLGLVTSIEPIAAEEMNRRQETGEFEAQLFLVSYTFAGWWGFFRSGDPLNFTGYSNPEFDAAAGAGNTERVRQIMDRDVLVSPLFNVPDVIASDTQLCGIKPHLLDLTWLSGVRLCASGETE